MEHLKKAEKDKEISEDEQKRFEANIQTLTDDATKIIDDMTSKKEADIMTV